MDVILAIAFSVVFYRMAERKGVSPWPYILNFISAVILVEFLMGYTILSMVGPNGLQTEEGLKTAMYFAPFNLAFVIFLYLYFRKRLQKAINVRQKEEDDYTPPPPPPKKDLSYFR
ncbi:MAG: hypothetical protein U0T75_01450 [Chitinophagales bacterium]